MKGVKTRRARPSELKIIQDLNYTLFQSDKERDEFLNHRWPYIKDGKEYFKKRIAGKNGICLVAEVDGKVVGYLAGGLKKVRSWRPVKRTELENMLVIEKFRSKGIGDKLVKEFLKWSKEKGVKRAQVVAYVTNVRAIKFYKRMGFAPESISLETPIKLRR